MGAAFFQFWNVVMGPTRLPLRLKELVRIANAAGKECAFCSIVRSESAKREGVSEQLLMELADYPGSISFSLEEKKALRFAELYRNDPEQLQTDESWTDLNQAFSADQIVELGILCMLTTGGTAFTKALRLEEWDRVCAINPRLAALGGALPARPPANP